MVGESSRLVRLLYPPVCVLCGAPGHDGIDLCAACRAELTAPVRRCPSCAAILPRGADGPCGACLRRPPVFDAAYAALSYRPPIDRLVTGLKFHGRLAMAGLFGELMAADLSGREPPDLIIPVPLHPKRLRERGFNQAREIARPLARRLGVPLAPQAATRIRATPPQTELDARARKRNVRGAFAATEDVAGRRIALVDDVMTIGATLDELAKAMKRAGAARVEVWVADRR